MKRLKHLFLCCLLPSLVLISGCQTHQERAAEQHLESIEKWKQLAQYARNSLQKYGIVITTQLSINDDQFVLTNFGFDTKETPSNINLLDPTFDHKYVCNPICSQLAEYVEITEQHGSTLLDAYFNKHEIDLFHLYGDLFHLNELINELETVNAKRLREFLTYIANQNQQFRSPQTFTKYLSRRLNTGRYDEFLKKEPGVAAQVQAEKQSQHSAYNWYQAHYENLGNVEMATWEAIKHAMESDHWSNSAGHESLQWEATEVQLPQGVAQEHAYWDQFKVNQQINQASMSKSRWRYAKTLAIEPKQKVCSFEGNYFGVVTQEHNGTYEVLLTGQAKSVIDGVIFDLEDGVLFSNLENLEFLPLDHYETFSKTDIAVCSLI